MNVINKLKSKKLKQQASQVHRVETQPLQKIEELPQKKTQQPPLSKPSRQVQLQACSLTSTFSEQPQIPSLPLSKASDMDEMNIDEYYLRKDKKKQLMSRMQDSGSFHEKEYLNSKHFVLGVRKSFNIGDISVFEGELSHRKEGRDVMKQKVKVSCSQDAIQFPQNISKIILSSVTMISDNEGIFNGDDIIRIAQKKHNKK